MEVSDCAWANLEVTKPPGTESKTKLLNDIDRQIIETVIYVFLCGLVSLFGTVANVINLVVFYKQGLNTTSNISFFALAISDLSSLLLQQWFSICVNPLFEASDIPMVPSEIQYISAGVPRVACDRITFFITVYITAERCLCTVFPLHVKQMITPRRAIVIIIAIYTVTILSCIPVYCTNNIDWKFYPDRNRTLLGLVTRWNRGTVEGIIYIIHFILGIISFVAVVLFTGILMRQLREKSAWRKTVSVDTRKSVPNKDRKTINLIVLIAVALIVCNIPGVLLFMTTFCEPELSARGRYSNLFYATWSFAFLFQAINSSVNIFLYFKMSTLYRKTFRTLFRLINK